MKRNNTKKGFTLIEMLVGMAIFVILLSIVVGIFIQAIRNQRLIAGLMMVNAEAGTVLEQMAREIRMGYKFSTTGETGLKFYQTKTDENGIQTKEEKEYSISGGGISSMTSSNIDVQSGKFIVTQDANKKCAPWMVTIILKIAKKNETDPYAFSVVQTSVTSRILPQDMPPLERTGDYAGCGTIN